MVQRLLSTLDAIGRYLHAEAELSAVTQTAGHTWPAPRCRSILNALDTYVKAEFELRAAVEAAGEAGYPLGQSSLRTGRGLPGRDATLRHVNAPTPPVPRCLASGAATGMMSCSCRAWVRLGVASCPQSGLICLPIRSGKSRGPRG